MKELPTTAVVTMLRNEIDILDAWLDHAEALFDHIFVVDHRSSDNTRQRLRERTRSADSITMFAYDERKNARNVVFDAVSRHALKESDCEWIFYLDPDEFLPCPSRTDLAECLEGAAESGIARFVWRNCYLERPGFCGELRGFRQVRTSGIGKVAIRRSIASDHRYRVSMGAHGVSHDTIEAPTITTVGELYHFPIRSPRQLWRKLLTGTVNRLRVLSRDPSNPSHVHYPALLGVAAEAPAWTQIPALVWDYGEHSESRPAEVSADEFEDWEFRFSGVKSRKSVASVVDVGSEQLVEILSAGGNPELLKEVVKLNEPNKLIDLPEPLLKVHGDLVANRLDFGGREFPPLESAPVEELSAADLITALQSCFWEIGHRVPSAWGEHIPLMFSLMTLARPRVYVELGVHNGASFLAACQAVRSRNLDTTCVAVDNWLGDAHAGLYRDDVFDAFVSALRPYDGFAGYMRTDFDKAVGRFEKGSIDLLHIDGLHTASAVMNDFETWLPRMSDRGIVLFHDTNEFRADFGVWRFWRNVREKYPYLEFGHGHGLGVLLVGEACPLRRPVADLGMPLTSPLVNELLQVMFGGVGHLSWHKAPPQAGNMSGPGPETNLELENLVARQEQTIRALQNSTSWRITAPLRAIVTRFRGR